MEPKTADNRTKIINAAYQVLSQQGYEATTIKQIAKAAEVAPGLLHYYFKNKNELLIEVLQMVSKQYLELMTQVKVEQPLPDIIRAGLAEPRTRVYKQPEWYHLRYELFALGLHNPEFKPGLAELLQSGRDGIGQILHKILGDKFNHSVELSGILLACFDGLALQKLADPNFDLEEAYQLLGRMLKAFFATLEN